MNARLINLMRLLLEKKEIITVSEIADRLEVSSKTVRNDLHSSKAYFDELEITLVKKAGVGVYIEASEEKKLEALNRLQRQTVGFEGYGPMIRHLLLLKELLFSKKKISPQELERKFFVSTTTIYNDIEVVRQWLSDRDILLTKDKQGRLECKGGEKRNRKAIFDWFFFCRKSLHTAEVESLLKDTFLGRKYAYERSERVVRNIEEVFRIKFVPEDFDGLVYKLCISFDRMLDGHYVTLKKETLDRLTRLKLYGVIDEVANYIKNVCSIHLPESEKGYLLGLVVSLKIYEGPEKWNVDESFTEVNLKITECITESIFKKIRISDREEVYKLVLNHVQTLVNQINYGLYSFHPTAEQVFLHYPALRKLAESFIPIFEREINYELTMSDVSEWVILLALIVEESKRPLMAVFVYRHKNTEARLTVAVLKNNFPQVEIVEIVPADSFKAENYKDFDVIFVDDAEQKEDTPLKMIVVPPLLCFADKMKIYDSLCKLYEEVNDPFHPGMGHQVDENRL